MLQHVALFIIIIIFFAFATTFFHNEKKAIAPRSDPEMFISIHENKQKYRNDFFGFNQRINNSSTSIDPVDVFNSHNDTPCAQTAAEIYDSLTIPRF